MNDFLNKIQGAYSGLTKAEKKVADYILDNPKQVIFMSITDLAAACGVGDTSVFRFCRTMELKGYQEFRMQLSLSMSNEEGLEISGGTQPINLADSFELLSQKVMQNNVSAINEAYSLLKPAEIARAMYYFEKAQRIYFFGVGTSMVSALAAMNKFLKITPKVQCFTDSHMQAMAASILAQDDLAVVISYSGSSKDTIQTAKLAKENGAKVVSITRHEKSPLTAYSDITILCGAHEGPFEGGSASAQMSILYLIDLLYMEYYKKCYETSAVNSQKTSESVLDKLC
ncbi:MAG TPA: MurR/RpiR family transcriptional regulator [Clostridiales bacterium]|nr:MurR/RpiR family transcriptional regulator [Clostridiales bacterium]